MSAQTQTAITDYWTRRAPAFDGVASHVAQAGLWRDVLEAAFEAEGPKDVVDFGTGTGACALIAAGLGHRVKGFDGSGGMLEIARRAAAAQGLAVEFGQVLIENAPVEAASVDIVTLRNVLWTLPEPMAALDKAYRTLRGGGRVLVSDGLWDVAPQYRSTYAEEVSAGLPLHAGLTEQQARAMLVEAGFAQVRSWQHLFPAAPYPGEVPMFVLSAIKV